MSEKKDFAGRVAFVTGAANGIGRAAALAVLAIVVGIAGVEKDLGDLPDPHRLCPHLLQIPVEPLRGPAGNFSLPMRATQYIPHFFENRGAQKQSHFPLVH